MPFVVNIAEPVPACTLSHGPVSLEADFVYPRRASMPTYEYQCPKGHGFELFQKMSDKPRARCPVCGKPAMRKISGGAALVFKGSGFYITDYGKDGKGPRKDPTEKSDSGGVKETKPAAESKSDIPSSKAEPKPAAKSESNPGKQSSSKSSRKAAPE